MISMKFTRSALALLATLLLAVACKQPPTPPSPSDTGMPGGGSQFGDPNFVNPSLLNRPRTDDAPPARDAAFSRGAGENGWLEGVLPSIYFDFDQSAVRPSDRPALQEAADYLMRNPGAKLLIEGHCDWRGTSEYNLALGERRAGNARDYLLSLGISADRVEIVSMGDLEATEVSDEVQLQQDRRADLIVIP
jgi:peptidoglycan-associated lipoprotein